LLANQRGRIPCFWVISTDDENGIAEEGGGGVGNTLRMGDDGDRRERKGGRRRFESG